MGGRALKANMTHLSNVPGMGIVVGIESGRFESETDVRDRTRRAHGQRASVSPHTYPAQDCTPWQRTRLARSGPRMHDTALAHILAGHPRLSRTLQRCRCC